MNILSAIKNRRSIRNFKTAHINRKDLELCLEAGRLSPSACNSQSWKFILVDNPSLLKKLSNKIFSGIYKMNAFSKNASALIVIVSNKPKFFARLGGALRNTNFQYIDAGIACENIVLQAQELGIGTCILGWFNESKLKKILHIPHNKKIHIIISLGSPGDFDLPPRQLKERLETVSINKY